MTTPTISTEHVSVRLGARDVLHDVSFKLDQTGLVALAGPNGAGKSTLIRVMAGLRAPDSGQIVIDGKTIKSLSPADRARMIAYMPQDRTVHWDLPARTVVALGRLPHRQAGASQSTRDDDAIDRALADVDAAHLADRPILSLSGGERARILMARALAQEARVLLADEPAAGLDPAHQWALFETLTKVAARGVRVIVAMHDLALMSRFAETMVLLSDGRLTGVGKPRDILSEPHLAQVYGITAKTIDGMLVPTGVTRSPAKT